MNLNGDTIGKIITELLNWLRSPWRAFFLVFIMILTFLGLLIWENRVLIIHEYIKRFEHFREEVLIKEIKRDLTNLIKNHSYVLSSSLGIVNVYENSIRFISIYSRLNLDEENNEYYYSAYESLKNLNFKNIFDRNVSCVHHTDIIFYKQLLEGRHEFEKAYVCFIPLQTDVIGGVGGIFLLINDNPDQISNLNTKIATIRNYLRTKL